MDARNGIVRLNVGGQVRSFFLACRSEGSQQQHEIFVSLRMHSLQIFETTAQTLCKEPNSFLARFCEIDGMQPSMKVCQSIAT